MIEVEPLRSRVMDWCAEYLLFFPLVVGDRQKKRSAHRLACFCAFPFWLFSVGFIVSPILLAVLFWNLVGDFLDEEPAR